MTQILESQDIGQYRVDIIVIGSDIQETNLLESMPEILDILLIDRTTSQTTFNRPLLIACGFDLVEIMNVQQTLINITFIKEYWPFKSLYEIIFILSNKDFI